MLTHLHMQLPETKGAPDWVHMLPAGEFSGADGRGPYTLADADAVITASMQAGKLVLDENHATDHALVRGGAAPAIAWIDRMESRPDGIWGHVAWERSGRQLMADRAYRGISPAFTSTDGRTVSRIVRASVTNAPNFALTHLHTENPGVSLDLPKIRRMFGLPEAAPEADIMSAIERSASAVTLHSQQVADAAGLDRSLAGEALITALRARNGAQGQVDAQVQQLTRQLADLKAAHAMGESTRYVDAAIGSGRAIAPAMRQELINLHSTSPNSAETIIKGLPLLKGGSAAQVQMHTQGNIDPVDRNIDIVARGLGLDPAKVRETIVAQGGV